MYLEKINGPEDVKKLTDDEMIKLAAEMRNALLKRASIHGQGINSCTCKCRKQEILSVRFCFKAIK